MTNILLLPQLSGSFGFAANADWRDAIVFVAEGSTTPIDLTGITFRSQIRSEASARLVHLDLSTGNGRLINGGETGRLEWMVPATALSSFSPGDYVTDLVAEADGIVVNLFQAAPAKVTVTSGVTR